MQLHDPIGVRMRGVEDLPRLRDSGAELLRYLPMQGGFLGFAMMDFSSRKLPAAGEVCALQATRDEKTSVPLDHSRNDDNALRHGVRYPDCADRRRSAPPSGRSGTSAFVPCTAWRQSPSTPG